MIHESLPPLSNQHPIGPEFLGECFSLIQLAYGNGAGGGGRARDSLVRSYAWDTFQFLPRVEGHAPSTVIAMRLSGKEKRIMVAIEGTNSLSQIQFGWQTVTATPFRDGFNLTYKPFNDRADEVLTALEAAGFDDLLTDNRDAQVIFTGHSLGAAIAEILANYFNRLHFMTTFQLWKFGSPKVGGRLWEREVASRMLKVSFYTGDDPMAVFPNYLPERGQFAPNLQRLVPGLLCTDDYNWSVNRNGSDGRRGYIQDFSEAVAMSRLWTHDTTDPANPWYWHRQNGYRYTITQMLARRTGIEAARYRYSETPDTNNWGQAYLQDGGITDDMLTSTVPPPADFYTAYEPPPPPNPNLPVVINPTVPRASAIITQTGRGEFVTPNRHRGHFAR